MRELGECSWKGISHSIVWRRIALDLLARDKEKAHWDLISCQKEEMDHKKIYSVSKTIIFVRIDIIYNDLYVILPTYIPDYGFSFSTGKFMKK